MLYGVIKMHLSDFKAFLQTDFHLSEIYAVQQRWGRKLTGVDLLDAPRRSNGLLLLTNCDAIYTLADGSVQQAHAGDVVLLPKGARYAVRFSVPSDGTAQPFLLNFRLHDLSGAEILPAFSVTRLCKDSGKLLPLFTETATLYKANAHPAQLKAAVYQIFSLLFPLEQADDCCIAYINTHFPEQFSIPQLAKRCALSESVYRRRFHQLTGLSPIQYINRLKIEKACQLLQGGDISLRDISDFLHFYSVSYFYRVFKAIVGCTPNAYRKRT